jgi:hypothetical protein
VPPVSSTIKSRGKSQHKGKHNRLDNGAGKLERQAMRRLMRKRFALLTREDIDRDSLAYRKFGEIIHDISTDLGGTNRLTTIQKGLIEAFASALVRVEDLTARQFLGDSTFYRELSPAISSLARVAYLLGIDRRPKEVTPTLSSYLKHSNGKSDEVLDGEIVQ